MSIPGRQEEQQGKGAVDQTDKKHTFRLHYPGVAKRESSARACGILLALSERPGGLMRGLRITIKIRRSLVNIIIARVSSIISADEAGPIKRRNRC